MDYFSGPTQVDLYRESKNLLQGIAVWDFSRCHGTVLCQEVGGWGSWETVHTGVKIGTIFSSLSWLEFTLGCIAEQLPHSMEATFQKLITVMRRCEWFCFLYLQYRRMNSSGKPQVVDRAPSWDVTISSLKSNKSFRLGLLWMGFCICEKALRRMNRRWIMSEFFFYHFNNLLLGTSETHSTDSVSPLSPLSPSNLCLPCRLA